MTGLSRTTRAGCRRSPLRATLCSAIVLASLAMSCGNAGDSSDAQVRRNVLIISIDTLRADHLGSHAYERPTSPRIDELAERSVVFENAQSSASWTLPGLASIMTSLYSSGHACWDSRSSLSTSTVTLAELLRDAGYDTACVVSHIFLTQRYGLQQGFTHFDDELDYPPLHPHEDISSPRVTERGIEWLEHKADAPDGEPWLLWLHYFDPHDTYLQHAGHSDAFGAESDLDLYDGEIHFTDEYVGHIFDALARTGLDENTVVILTADHGEEFGDHGGTTHGRTLYHEQLNVPLMIDAPGFEARRVPQLVRTVDILPTLLDLVGMPAPIEIEGRSLTPLMRGEQSTEEPALAEIRLRKSAHFDAVIQSEWKLIVDADSGAIELFHLADDPGELRNVAEEEPERVQRMQRLMQRMIAESSRRAPAERSQQVDLSPAEIEVLRGLGYVGADEE